MFGYEIKKKPKRNKKIEFSKLIFICISFTVFCVVAFSCVMMWRTMDTSPLSYLITSLFAELATATGFYYEKAKQENIRKYNILNNQPESVETENTYKEPEA